MKQLSLQLKLQGIIAGISILGLSMLAFQDHHSFKNLDDEQKDSVRMAVDSAMDKIDRNLFERYGDVQAFASSESARSMDSERLNEFIADMVKIYSPVYEVMMVTDTKGNVIAVNSVDKVGKKVPREMLLGKNYSDEEWFKASVKDQIKVGSAFVEDFHFNEVVKNYTKTDGRVMSFSSPIREKDTGRIIGVWVNFMSWKDVVLKIIAAEEKAYEINKEIALHFVLLGKDGTFLHHPTESLVLKEKLAGFEEVKNGMKDNRYLRSTDSDVPSIKGEVFEASTASTGFESYPGNHWILQMEAPVDVPEKDFQFWMMIGSVVAVLLGNLVAAVYCFNMTKSLQRMIDRLTSGSQEVKETSSEIFSSADELAQATTEQAAALQETAASIEEMSAMTRKSAESADRSRQSSQQSQSTAISGKDAVQNMVHAIEDIKNSNTAIMGQVTDSNQRIAEIVKVIQEIGNKTKVINDIVFQTKLLSFNASVEAARAGEHGKGFAVVAEEVGNLAQMSGNAAKEIGDLLSSSLERVETIIKDSSDKVQRLITDSYTKVESGTTLAHECGGVLDKVVNSAEEVNGLINEISTASSEQTSGISEISKAINELNKVTQVNSAASQKSAQSATNLHQQADELFAVVNEMTMMVKGHPATDISGRQVHPSTRTVQPAPRALAPVKKLTAEKKFTSGPVAKPAEAQFTKKAAGSDFIPDENDPRFRDV